MISPTAPLRRSKREMRFFSIGLPLACLHILYCIYWAYHPTYFGWAAMVDSFLAWMEFPWGLGLVTIQAMATTPLVRFLTRLSPTLINLFLVYFIAVRPVSGKGMISKDRAGTGNQDLLEQELKSGETIQWRGRPRQGVIFRPEDVLIFPGVLLIGFLAVFFSRPFGILFIPIFFMFFFFYYVLDKSRRETTYYGITNERALIICTWSGKRIISIDLRSVNNVTWTNHTKGGRIDFIGGIPASSLMITPRDLPPRFELAEDPKPIYDLVAQIRSNFAAENPANTERK